MAFRKKTKKKTVKEEVSSFSTSDFSVKAATTGSVDVAAVSGISNYASTTNYNATIDTTVNEVSASIDAVLTSVTASSGHSLAITTTFPVIITASSISQAISGEVTTISTATSGLTATGTLAQVSEVSAYRALSLSLDISAGAYTMTDIGSGVLSANALPISGTVSGNTWTIDFTNQEILTDGTAITESYEVSYPYKVTSTPIVIAHTVVDGAPYNGTATAIVSAVAIDPAASTAFTSSAFVLSANEIPNNNPWKGKGALPGETRLETAGRFIDEGVI